MCCFAFRTVRQCVDGSGAASQPRHPVSNEGRHLAGSLGVGRGVEPRPKRNGSTGARAGGPGHRRAGGPDGAVGPRRAPRIPPGPSGGARPRRGGHRKGEKCPRDPRSGRYLIQDPTLPPATSGKLWLSPEVLDSEGSGYYLVPAAPLPDGWSPVSEAEGSTIWGRGPTENNVDHATGEGQTQAGPCSCSAQPRACARL